MYFQQLNKFEKHYHMAAALLLNKKDGLTNYEYIV